MRAPRLTVGLIAVALAAAAAARHEAAMPTAAQQASGALAPVTAFDALLKPVAGIQDLMALEVDPAADALWAMVSTTVTSEGEQQRQPRTDAEWAQARAHALVLVEAANLLVMDGRRVTRTGVQTLEDDGTPGNLTAAESQRAIDGNRPAFVAFAQGLRKTGEGFLAAIEAKDADGMLAAGETMDQMCEGCHLQFWYPGQRIPRFPDEAPELAVTPAD